MNIDDLTYWQNLIIVGREDDDEEGDGEDDEGHDDGDDGEEGEDEGGQGGSDSDKEEGEDPDAKIKALEKALTDERRLRRKAERESKRKGRQKAKEEKSSDDQETQEQLRAAHEKTQRLAQGLLNQKRDAAILAEARKQGFIDPTDALTDDIREDVDIDQDEDDPSDIDVDYDSVADAVRDLANRKKHLVGNGTPNTPSGSRRRKGGPKTDEELSDQNLRQNYPSLN